MLKTCILPLLIAAAMSAPALAQVDLPEPQPIELVDGKAVIEGHIAGQELASYRFSAMAGQAITVTLTAPTPSANFNVLPLGDPTAIFVGGEKGQTFDGSIPADGDYEIRVYLLGQASRTGSADFKLNIALAAGGPATAAAGTVPLFNAECPTGLSVHGDEGGAVYLNGNEAKVTFFSPTYFEAALDGNTISVTTKDDGVLDVSYTGSGGANGVCTVKPLLE